MRLRFILKILNDSFKKFSLFFSFLLCSFSTFSQDQLSNATTPLYDQIVDDLNREYVHIGEREAARLLQNRSLSVIGGLNSVGISYKKPFVDFTYMVDRNLAPDLFHNTRWIVTDTMTVMIDASKVIGRLANEGKIDLAERNLNAFTGLVFKRSYKYVHFANSYEEGLMRDFEKLFFPFKYFSPEKLSSLGSNEFLIKEDSITINVGGLASAPLYQGVTGIAGVLAKYQRLTRTEAYGHAINENDLQVPELERPALHISFDKTEKKSLGASMAIQLEFLKILKLTLLSYDFSYTFDKSVKIYLDFKQKDISKLKNDNALKAEISSLLKAQDPKINILKNYIVSEEKRESTLKSSKYSILLMGGMKDAKTQQIEIVKEGKVKRFFKHYFEKTKYQESLGSKLFSGLLYALLDINVGASKDTFETKKVSLEYESETDLLSLNEKIDLSDEEKLSLDFTTTFNTNKTKGRSGERNKEKAIFYLDRFSGVDPMAVNLLKSDFLQAPLQIHGKYQLTKDALFYFNKLSTDKAFDSFASLCNEYPKNKFFNFRNLFDNCRNGLKKKHLQYLADLRYDEVDGNEFEACQKRSAKFIFKPSKKRAFLKKCLAEVNFIEGNNLDQIPLNSLKNIVDEIHSNSYSKVDYYNLFGVKNIFFYGSMTATTADGNSFTTNFHEGAFRGLGLVDHYMRMENMRFPASVDVD